ncbi:MAG: hypothetical protein WD049_00215 [Candidatus Paceibacterota bacterium]
MNSSTTSSDELPERPAHASPIRAEVAAQLAEQVGLKFGRPSATAGQLVNREEMAERLTVSVEHLDMLVALGSIPSFKDRETRMFDPRAVLEHLKQKKSEDGHNE